MQTSINGIDLIKKYESFSRTAYYDAVGVLTIGYGHTEDVEQDDIMDKETAELVLRKDLKRFEDAVNQAVTQKINQNQFDAMVSLAYNIGDTAFRSSTLVRCLNAGKYGSAAEQFDVWVRGGGREILPGLVARRKEERELFSTPYEIVKYKLVSPPDDWKNAKEITKEMMESLIETAKENNVPYKFKDNKLYLGVKSDKGKVAAKPPAIEKEIKKPFDFHLVCNLSKRQAKLFNAEGKLLTKVACRGEGVNGEFKWTGTPYWKAQGSDTPPGTWSWDLVERITTRNSADVPYGRMFIYMTPKSGEALRLSRPGIGSHGGGSGLSNPFGDYQGWVVTHGCIRFQNKDLENLVILCSKNSTLQKVLVTTIW